MSEEVTVEALQKELETARQSLHNKNEENKQLRTAKESAEAKLSADPYKKELVRAKAELALAGQGIKNADKLLKYLDMNGIDFDEEGALTGLDEKVSSLKEDVPSLFDVKRSVGGIDQAGINKPGPKPKLSAEQIAAKSMGLPVKA